MGQTLSEPVVEKNSSHGKDDRVTYGVSAMQGWRISMEDAHSCVLDLKPETADGTVQTDSRTRISFFGVYDGHGGDKVAIYAGENLHKIIAKQDAFKENNFEQALKDGFLATDRAILNDPKYEEEVSGCTASVGIITHDRIYVGNSGDSRTVLGVKGRAKPLSFDHKPQNEAEKSRICAAGGFVDFGRVNGNLALSRAIGDFEFKKTADLPPESQIVTAFPDVSIHDVSDDDEFLVIACDGIWDCQSSQAVVEFVRRGIAAKQELQSICENMMDNCLASNSETGGVGCDNMTMVVVGLLKGKTKDEWYQHIADRVANGDGPCAPPEYGKSSKAPRDSSSLNSTDRRLDWRSILSNASRKPAEFRGPGVHHVEDSPDDYDMDLDQRTRSIGGGRSGRIILLGDGTEVLTDNSNTNMFENIKDEDDEDHDSSSSPNARGQREDTPAPDSVQEPSTPNHVQSPSSRGTKPTTFASPDPADEEVKSPVSPLANSPMANFKAAGNSQASPKPKEEATEN